jgi:hypothetical protein
MHTDHGIREILHWESDESHEGTLATCRSKCRGKVKDTEGECARVHNCAKWEIERLGVEQIASTFKNGNTHKRTSMAPAARVNCQA